MTRQLRCQRAACKALAGAGLVAVVAVGMSGCASPPVTYHTLTAPSGDPLEAHACQPFSVYVLPVDVPPEVDEVGLVTRRGQSVVEISQRDRWATPLPAEIRGALSAALGGGDGCASTAPAAPVVPGEHRPHVRVRLSIQRFDAWPGDALVVSASWRVTVARSANAPVVRTASFREGLPVDVSGQVRTEQAVMRQIGDAIRRDVELAVEGPATAASGAR